MLHYISKTRFEGGCLGKTPRKTLSCSSFLYEWPYYEIPEKNSWALYLRELSTFVIFGEGDVREEDLTVDLSDWKLNKISDKPDPRYILNLMKMSCHLNYEFGKTCGTGIWELVNSRTGERFEFSIKRTNSYFESVGIGYPEKLEIPFDKTLTYTIDNFIEDLCNGLRGNNN